ncbi:MAG: MoxR family ATPase [Planctomycetota bacterium]|nr:MoxR family ATPase [Planctomycetota bacterium]
MSTEANEVKSRIEEQSALLETLFKAVETIVVGQKFMIERLVIGLLTGGHVLLEGVPGLAKTLTINTLAKAIAADFQRIQFTPDLLPSDLIGTLIYNPKEGGFSVKKGPIFAQLILADEINRAPAKVQSALLEVMQEKQVTLGDETHKLKEPFLVLATQNPIEQEGTYPLPEAQVDRFMMKLRIHYPSRSDERTILDRMGSTAPKLDLDAIIKAEQILDARKLIDEIRLDDSLKDYIVELIHATRNGDSHKMELARFIEFGASPRATIALALASKAHAFLRGREYVVTDDVKTMARDVLRHRVIPSYEAEAEGIDSDKLVSTILNHVPVP